MEEFYKFLAIVLMVICFALAYSDKNLDGVKNAWIYKSCVGLVCMNAILIVATKWLHLW